MSPNARRRGNVRGKAKISVPRPASGPLELVQAFLNTRNRKHKPDELSNPWELGRWLSSRGLLPEASVLTEEDLRRAHDVREGLLALVAVHAGYELDERAVTRLREALRGVRLAVTLETGGEVVLEPATASVADALGVLVGRVAESQHEGTWPRFKACGDSRCRAAYYDARNTGKWCSRLCGDVMRARTYRRSDKYRPQTTIYVTRGELMDEGLV